MMTNYTNQVSLNRSLEVYSRMLVTGAKKERLPVSMLMGINLATHALGISMTPASNILRRAFRH